jgi:hypothetical protein
MAITICPWCQSEILQEEGQEPDKICPVCDNEIDGYRTLKLNIGGSVEDEEDEDEEDEDEDEEKGSSIVTIDEDVSWDDDQLYNETSEDLLQFEETVEQLLNEQELVPECPICHENMLESGEQLISVNEFRPKVPDNLGEAIIEAPFSLTMYICPTCFSIQSVLADSAREQVVRRLSEHPSKRKVRSSQP